MQPELGPLNVTSYKVPACYPAMGGQERVDYHQVCATVMHRCKSEMHRDVTCAQVCDTVTCTQTAHSHVELIGLPAMTFEIEMKDVYRCALCRDLEPHTCCLRSECQGSIFREGLIAPHTKPGGASAWRLTQPRFFQDRSGQTCLAWSGPLQLSPRPHMVVLDHGSPQCDPVLLRKTHDGDPGCCPRATDKSYFTGIIFNRFISC